MPSQLQQAYGPEPNIYYGDSLVNRLSFLREDYAFLHAALNHPAAQFMVLDNLAAHLDKLPKKTSSKEPQSVKDVTFTPRQPLFRIRFVQGDNRALREFVGQPFQRPQQDQVAAWTSARDAPGAERPLVVFLGLDQAAPADKALTYTKTSDNGDDKTATTSYRGQPYFAVDANAAHLSAKLRPLAAALLGDKALAGATTKAPPVTARLPPKEAGLYAQARMYVDWNQRNAFCGGCGRRNMPVDGGCKLTCPPTDGGTACGPCARRGTLSNLSFPRTDVSVIAAILSHDGTRLLLGRGPKWPKGFFSCLAGFLEPGETVEDCVRREVYEEAGLAVGRVVVHATQPWPYPANIMVGCVAQVTSPEAEAVHLGHDPELEAANWYSLADVEASLVLSANDYKGPNPGGVPLIPGPEALAFTLLEAVVSGRVHGLERFSSKL